MIVVTGATGTIGNELVRLLSEHGARVRALSRHPEDGEDRDGVDWVEADLGEPSTVVAACAGAERLFLLTGNTDGMVRLQKNALDAAEEAGVRHVVKLSALGASNHSRSTIALWHHNVETALRRAGVDWTILRPHHFMQNLLDPSVFDRETGTVRAPSGDGLIPFIDTRDVARVANTVLTDDGHDGETYTLTGPEAISYGDATATIARELDRDLDYHAEDLDEAWRRLRAEGLPPWSVASLLEIARYHRAGGPTERVTDTVETITGEPPRTMEDFVRDHRAALEAQE